MALVRALLLLRGFHVHLKFSKLIAGVPTSSTKPFDDVKHYVLIDVTMTETQET